MRVEHVVVSIIIFLVILLALLAFAGKIVPTFEAGLRAIVNFFVPK
jgi:hypothetical protein